MALFGAGAHGKRRKQVEHNLEGNPSWGLVVKNKWVCPYCTKLTVIAPNAQADRVEAILDHLDGACPDYRGGEGAEHPFPSLRQVATRRALRTLVKQQLVKSRSWQLIDYSQRWFCAYCGDATSVLIPKDRKMTEQTLQGIMAHVESCYAYERGKGREKPFKHLKAIVRYQNQSRKLAENVRTKLEGDPIWRRKDPRNRWICPYCLVAQDHIDLSSNLLMFENAPTLIAKHLAAACDPFKSGGQPQPLGAKKADLLKAFGDRKVPDGDVFANSERLGDLRPPVDPVTGQHRSTSRLPTLDADVETNTTDPGSGRWEKLATPSERYSRTLWGKDGETAQKRVQKSEAGTTLRQMAESGEYLLVDDELNDFNALVDSKSDSGPRRGSAAAEKTEERVDESRARSVSSWRREIEEELASVRSLPTAFELSGEHSLTGPRQGDEGEDDKLAADLGLAGRGLELRRVRVLAKSPRGDFVEAIPLAGNRLAIFAGGVAGDDSEAPLIAAMAKNLITQNASSNLCPGEVLRRVNQDIFNDLDGRSFVAVAYALVDLGSCRARFARAGLAAPVLLSASGGPVRPLDCEGMVMGIDKGPIFNSSLEVRQVTLEPGDLLAIFTNGVMEARNARREEFGLDRTHALIERYGTHELAYFVDKFKEHFGLHARGRARTDGCVIAIKRADGAA